MAGTRKSRSVITGKEPIVRRRARQYEQEVPDEDVPEAIGEDEPEAVEEDEPEAVDEDDLSVDGQRSSSGRPARRGTRPPRGATRPAHGTKQVLTPGEAVKVALREAAEFTGKQAEGITDVERTEDGWKIGFEVLEERRIPSSADILATYEAIIDENGELISYRRVRRYPRGWGDELE
jgi:hypothetical protein